VEGTSSKFWHVGVTGRTVITRWGRIGSRGQETRHDFATLLDAVSYKAYLIMSKRRKGYVEKPIPSWFYAEAPPAPKQPGSPKPDPADSARGSGTGRGPKDTYKVYPGKGHRRVVRVGGKLYGTQMGGKLKDGGQTKFNADDRAKVQPDGGRMKVSKQQADGSSHSQTWDPVEEAVVSAVCQLLAEIAAG
jgi:predicted DNA-binding WGR domain protein